MWHRLPAGALSVTLGGGGREGRPARGRSPAEWDHTLDHTGWLVVVDYGNKADWWPPGAPIETMDPLEPWIPRSLDPGLLRPELGYPEFWCSTGNPGGSNGLLSHI